MRLANVVGGGNLGFEIDLTAISESIEPPVIRYEPEIYPGMYLRFVEDGATVMAFASGKYNIAGARSFKELQATNEQFISCIEDLFEEELPDVRESLELRNLVFVEELDQSVDLLALQETLGLEHTEYEPEQFPAIDYRPPDYEGLFKIFSSGKVTLTGVTDQNSVDAAFEKLKKDIVRISEEVHSLDPK